MSVNFESRFEEEISRVGITTVANTLGVARNTVYNWISKGNAPLNMLMALGGLGVDLDYVITGSKEVKTSAPSVLKRVHEQELIEAAKVIKNDKLSHLPKKATESNAKCVNYTHLKKNPDLIYPTRQECKDYGKQAAEGQADYQPLRPDQLALLDNFEHCPKEAQDAIRTLALVSARTNNVNQ